MRIDDLLRTPDPEFDQMQAFMTQMAQLLFGYRADLIAAGFTKADAMRLTCEFQAALFRRPPTVPPSGD